MLLWIDPYAAILTVSDKHPSAPHEVRHHQQHYHQLEKAREIELPFLDTHGLDMLGGGIRAYVVASAYFARINLQGEDTAQTRDPPATC